MGRCRALRVAAGDAEHPVQQRGHFGCREVEHLAGAGDREQPRGPFVPGRKPANETSLARNDDAASPDDYSGPTKWLIDNLVLGFMINVVFALLVSIAGVLLVLLPAGVLHARREMRDRDPNVTAADLTGVTVGGFVLIGLLALVFVVPTLLVVANDQSGTTQLVLRIVGIALGVVGFGAALVIGSLKRSGASRDG